MPEWFVGKPAAADVTVEQMVGRLVVAALLGIAVGAAYLVSRRYKTGAAPLVATLVLLTILLAMSTLVIGDSAARAFGLVGALSIIRFRTVVEDPRDTAFVIFAVVVGMAAGSGNSVVAVAGIPIVAAAAWLLSVWGRGANGGPVRGTLVVRLAAGLDPAAVLDPVLPKHVRDPRLVATSTARQGAAIDLTYAVKLAADATVLGLVGELSRTEGVLGVEWKETGG